MENILKNYIQKYFMKTIKSAEEEQRGKIQFRYGKKRCCRWAGNP